MISATPVHWLDANDPTTVIQSGGRVTAWNDKSATAANGTAVTTGNGAITYDSVSRGIVFSENASGNEEYFSTTNTTLYKQTAFTIFAVETRSAGTTSHFYGSLNTSGLNNLLHVGYANNTSVRFGFFSNDLDYSTTETTNELANSRRRLWAFRLPASGSRTIRYFGSVVSTLGNVQQLVSNSNTIQIGRYRTTGWYNGTLHEIIGYHGDLTDSEVEQMEGYLAWKWGLQMDLPTTHPYSPVNGNAMFPTGSRIPRADTSCFCFFNFLNDTTSSTVLTDLSPNGNNFTRNQATYTTIGGRRALTMPAEGSAIGSYPVRTSTGMISSNNTFTWCGWVYMTPPITPSSYHTLFFTRFGTVTGLQIDALNSYKARYTWGGSFFSVLRNLTVDLNAWTHVALTISPTQALFYKNGILVDTVSNTHTAQTFNQLYLGYDPSNTTRFFPGYMDDIAIYTRVLTGTEILQIVKFGAYQSAQIVDQIPRPLVGTSTIQYYWGMLDYATSVSSYALVVTSNTGSNTILIQPFTTSFTLSNLTTSADVSGSIYQINGLNNSSPLVDFRRVTTGDIPGAPQTVTYTPVGPRQARIEWTAPTTDGGAGLLGYFIQDSNETIRLSAKSYHFSRLTPQLSTGTQQFSVQAVNDPGYGPKAWTSSFTIPFV